MKSLIKFLDMNNVIINWNMPGNKTKITNLPLKKPMLSSEWTCIYNTLYGMHFKNSRLIFSPMISS